MRSSLTMRPSFGVNGVEYLAHPWEMGARKAKEFLFTCDAMSAAEAHRLGMVNHVVPLAQLQDFALTMAKKIATKPLFALKLAKESVNAMEDVQGRVAAMNTSFAMHQLAHTHNLKVFNMLLDPSGLPPKTAKTLGLARPKKPTRRDGSSDRWRPFHSHRRLSSLRGMLGPGDIAPDFELPCASRGRASTIRLRDHAYRSTSRCFSIRAIFPSSARPRSPDSTRHCKSFEDAKCSVVGISIDDVESHLQVGRRAWRHRLSAASDVDGKIARAFGVFDEDEKVALRATFVMRKDRAIAARARMSIQRRAQRRPIRLRVVQAIGTGQMCPAEWKPGMDTRPDPIVNSE